MKEVKGKNVLILDLGPSEEAEELLANLKQYVIYLGWTQKRFFLEGAATMVAKENPQLAQQIADYVIGVGGARGRPPVKPRLR